MRLKMLCILACLVSIADAGPGRDALDLFTADLTSLQARFEQSVLDTENNRQGLYHGSMTVKRPDRFRWDYLTPERKQIIADGKNLWIIDTELSQVTQYAQSLALKNSPALVLLGEGSLEESFAIIERGEKRGKQWLELIPIDSDSDVLRILLAFEEDQLLQLETTDNFGQVSRFRFFDMQRNPDLADEQFQYQLPFGWDLYTQEGG